MFLREKINIDRKLNFNYLCDINKNMTNFRDTTLFWILSNPLSYLKRKSRIWKIYKQRRFIANSEEVFRQLSLAIEAYPRPLRIWLEFGTLLGAYRDKKVISYDPDIDLGIDEDDFSFDVIEHFEKFGFKRKMIIRLKSEDKSLDGFIAYYKAMYKDIVTVDFFLYKTINGKKKCFTFDYEGKGFEVLRTSKIILNNFYLTKMKFLGQEFLIPNNVQEHLIEIYGEDFMTPKKYSYNDRPRDYEILLDKSTLGDVENM